MFFRLQYFLKFDLAPILTEEEFGHWFISRPNIIDSFVVEVTIKTFFFASTNLVNVLPTDLHSETCGVQFQNDGNVTDMVSFYTLPSSIMHHQTHKLLKAAYSFYNVFTKTPLLDLMTDALIVAKNVSIHHRSSQYRPRICRRYP